MRDYVFIVGQRRSGSTLLMSLLDGHPELSVFPSELLYYLYTETNWSSFFPQTKFKASELTDKLLEPLAMNFRKYSDSVDNVGINWKEYIKYCGKLLDKSDGQEMTRLEHMGLLFDTMEEFYNKPKGKLRIAKPMDCGFDWIDEELKPCKLLYTYRNPEYIYLGWRKRWKREGLSLWSFYRQRFKEIAEEFKNAKGLWDLSIKDRDVFVVGLQRLQQATKDTMSRVCQHLGIEWDDCLLEPTINGISFQGFYMDSTKNTGGISTYEHSPKDLWWFERSCIAQVGLYL